MRIDLSGENDTRVRALYQAILRAQAAERTEVARNNRLATTGYENRAGGSLASEADRASLRLDVLTDLLAAVQDEMNIRG